MSNKGNNKLTLCLDCANATNGGCNWSRSLIPVDGWTAYKDKVSYLVIDCPEFISDKKGEQNGKV